jgi:hypothetical protein
MYQPAKKVIGYSQDGSVVLEPLAAICNEIRHTRSTMAFLRSLIEENKLPSGKLLWFSGWKNELSKLSERYEVLKQKFVQEYLSSINLVREFELRDYDRLYLEINFLNKTTFR